MKNLPEPPYTARIAKEPRQIFIVAENQEIARLDVSFEDLEMSDEEWEKRMQIAKVFTTSIDMALLLEDLSGDERIPNDRIREINTILDELEG